MFALAALPLFGQTVTDDSDDPNDTGSLRYNIANAPAGSTIMLQTPLPGGNTITIIGPGPKASNLIIDGGMATGFFVIPPAMVTLKLLTIQHSFASVGGGGRSYFERRPSGRRNMPASKQPACQCYPQSKADLCVFGRRCAEQH